MHLFPQLWWERHKGHCGWRKGPGNRQRSPYLGKYPNQSPKTDKQAFASGWSWVGKTEVFLCCVNLSLTQKELECERDLRIEENICLKKRRASVCLCPLVSWVGITEVFLCCVNLSTQKELECERGKDRAGAGHIAIRNRTLGCQ